MPRKIFIAIAADEPMHTVMGAVIAAPAQLPQSVTFCTWILRPLDPLRGTVVGSDSASIFSPTDRLPIWVTVPRLIAELRPPPAAESTGGV
jgi:hypothetical protein